MNICNKCTKLGNGSPFYTNNEIYIVLWKNDTSKFERVYLEALLRDTITNLVLIYWSNFIWIQSLERKTFCMSNLILAKK